MLVFLCLQSAWSQSADSLSINIDSLLQFKTGKIDFPSCEASLETPAGFRFLDAEGAQYVLSSLWGNPSDSTILGLLVPDQGSIMDSNAYVFVITYDAIGYVKDDDANDIDYEELLVNMKKETSEASLEREKLGYEKVELVGWASAPYYDEDKKVLHWAKEIKFGDAQHNTLNYHLRVLGKKGVFVLNAVASMSELERIKGSIDGVLGSVKFNEGNTYADFDPDVDEVAAWTVGGLVAGKVLSKVGLLAGLAKFSKIIFVGLFAGIAAFWKFLTGRKKDENNKPSNTEIS